MGVRRIESSQEYFIDDKKVHFLSPNTLGVTQLLRRLSLRGGLMVSALDSGLSGPGSRPGQGHCVVFMGKTLDSGSAREIFQFIPFQ